MVKFEADQRAFSFRQQAAQSQQKTFSAFGQNLKGMGDMLSGLGE